MNREKGSKETTSEVADGILANQGIRHELTEYYKWIVSLAVLILTMSLSLAGLFGSRLHVRWPLILGWVLLGICVLFNWLIIKRLVSIPIVASVPENQQGFQHKLFMTTMGNLKKYGLIQNWAFLLGVLSLGVGFALNLLSGAAE